MKRSAPKSVFVEVFIIQPDELKNFDFKATYFTHQNQLFKTTVGATLLRRFIHWTEYTLSLKFKQALLLITKLQRKIGLYFAVRVNKFCYEVHCCFLTNQCFCTNQRVKIFTMLILYCSFYHNSGVDEYYLTHYHFYFLEFSVKLINIIPTNHLGSKPIYI